MEKKKKILFLVTQSEFGGAQRFIYNLVTNLNKNRYDALIAAGAEGDNENGFLNLLDKQGIKTERLKHLKRSINPFFDLLGLFEIKKLLEKVKPDILFLCSTKAGFLGSLANHLYASVYRNSRPLVIYRIGGWTFNDPWSKRKKKLYIWLEKFSAKWKDYIINNAESDRRQATELGIKPKKEILTIHNGIDANELEFLSKEEARQQINLISNYSNLSNQIPNSNDIIVGTIANDYPAKGLKYLREAEKRMFDVGNVRFVTLSGIPDAHKYLKAFDVFVLPSVKEGFPWVILEAMSAEIPVIATNVGAVPEIIQDGENGLLIDPGKTEQIVEAIEKLSKDKELRDKLVIRARKTVEEKFNLNQMTNEFVKLFDA